MTQYNFDQLISRQGTHSVKWEFKQAGNPPMQLVPSDDCFGEKRVLPMWVADMDFPSPAPVVEALQARAAHGIFGYTVPTTSYFAAVTDWLQRRHGWTVAPEWICPTPGVVPAINMLVRTFTEPGDKVLIQSPVYYPFNAAILNNQRVVVNNPLHYADGRYTLDFADLAAKAQDPLVKLIILCNPHNPVGRVWTPAELQRLGEICLENNVLVVADEIHGDLVYPGETFTPLASLSPALAANAITCTAPSKTFNLAGLHASNIIIPAEARRLQYQHTLRCNGLLGIGVFGVVALEAAYTHGEEWLTQMLTYLAGNLAFLEDYVARHLPGITVVHPEGTYLVWLDCRALGLNKEELQHLMYAEAGVYLDEGYIFGPEGEGFERLNIACPRALLAEALERIRRVLAVSKS